MKFDSKSITLNRGVNLKVEVILPPKISNYIILDDVWEESINEFNKELDERSTVSEIVRGIKIDVLRINRTMGNVVLWMTVKENDIDTVNALKFILKGKVVFEDDKSNKVERMIIQDLLFSDQWPGEVIGQMKSIFKKKKKELTT
jgi:hypothetical protein